MLPDGSRRALDGALGTFALSTVVAAGYAWRQPLEAAEPLGPVAAFLVSCVAVGTVAACWRPREGLAAAWLTAVGPLLGFAVFLAAFGPRVRWVYPGPETLLVLYGAAVVAGPLAALGVLLGSWRTGDTRAGRSNRRVQGAALAVVVAGVAYLLGLPDVLWWPQALTAFWAFAVAVVASVVAAALGASA
ncbi:hypothetical protein [Halospeciosus flavus]|uniref:Uncharacterized protein n=1 Tax=Halospeciosus flavus TaxID=3032283 RepID=A0ABD5Z8N7_9EURY|nr:hypothetical protein [Halospeciosus flavus]